MLEIVLASLVVKPESTELSISDVAVLERRPRSKALPQPQFEPWLRYSRSQLNFDGKSLNPSSFLTPAKYTPAGLISHAFRKA
jgi:hypothetical protein